MNKIHFRIEGLPKTTNSGGRSHWRAKAAEAKKWREASMWKVLAFSRGLNEQRVKTFERANLHLVRNSSSEPDYDGLVSSFKHVIDGIVDSGVIPNDKSSTIGVPTYEWKKAPQKSGFIEVTIEEIKSGKEI